jgi:hypothetical protein
MLICGLIEGKDSSKIRDGDKVVERHVEEGVFAPLGAMFNPWSKTKMVYSSSVMFKEVSQKGYWMQLVQCLLDNQAPLLAWPTEWSPPHQFSPCGYTSSAPAVDIPEGDTNSSDRGDGAALPPPSFPPCRHLPPPPPPHHQIVRGGTTILRW